MSKSIQLNQAIEVIRSFFRLQRRLPSYQEMCQLFGFASKKASFDLAKKLIDAGFIEKDEKGKLVPKQLFPAIPLLGSIKAGYPTTAEEQLLDTMSIHNYLINRPEKSYILKVSGDSMIEAGIHPGDLVIIEKDSEPKDGDIVVANIDNEFTLKYFNRKEGRVCLIPANKNYPVLYPGETLTIFGVVISVIRKYH